MSDAPVIVAGGGQAGAQAAVSLRQAGFEGRIVLVGDEPSLPYQRPPLSKDYLAGKLEESGLLLRAEKVYADQRVELMLGEQITAIDTARRSISLASGGELAYSHLVLATGARNRPLPAPGAELDGVFYLRTLAEARSLRERLGQTRRAVVVGGGFIGLEFAAAARAHGIAVSVVEAAARPMSRVLSVQMSSYLAARHDTNGVPIILNRSVQRFVGENGRLTGVVLDDGTVLEADLAVVGIGVLPNAELAEAAGLAVKNGVVVDENLLTSDPFISAIGDCASFPSSFAGGLIRLESVQNATDQARCVAARLAGKPTPPYNNVPWFWSEQYDVRLQMAGITSSHDQAVLRGSPDDNAFSVFCFRDGAFLGAESVNRTPDHLAVRKLLAAGIAITPEQAADLSFDLKLAAAPPAAAAVSAAK
ncbi:NAD(P)/FAD-dependent oxidoreductase [Lacisediminimonas sp.]|uniref:NAD(P)/FAD-dependent oxidoreductase n=1 Tax=Lacisediminimonas sp. TaxID=3060582 RepID=UPI002723D36A|nr:FAD-dependent oxidoreductase [Lacisediminimonas sp.]MDO8299143.1 FAD-dependent oxidoreductase [Lacisediminimonas sp.]